MSEELVLSDVSRYRFQPQAGRNVDVDVAQTIDNLYPKSDDLDMDLPDAPSYGADRHYGLRPNEVQAPASSSVGGLDQLIEQVCYAAAGHALVQPVVSVIGGHLTIHAQIVPLK